jgi:hypothetical protein
MWNENKGLFDLMVAESSVSKILIPLIIMVVYGTISFIGRKKKNSKQPPR